MPKVSIIVPVYNGENYIRKCVDSILNQEFKDFELFLIDDKSDDNSFEIMNEYAKKDERVISIHSDENVGVSGSRNIALDKATGEYIQFVDCDDYIVRDATKNFVRAIEKSNCDMVISHFYRVVGDMLSLKGDIEKNIILSRDEFVERLAENPADYYYAVLWNKFYKRDIIEKNNIRFDKNVRWCEDFIFNMEYLLHVENIESILSPTYYYVKTEGSLVSQSISSLTNIVRMKLSVIEYYNEFFKKIYKDENSIKRKLNVYKFLFDYSKDEFTIPFFPGTKKVGKEDVPVYINEYDKNNLFLNFYYMNKLLDRYLYSVAIRFKLELRELKVLIYLRYNKKIVDFKEVADYVSCSQISIFSILQMLYLKKYVSVVVNDSKTEYSLGNQSKQVMETLDDVMRDFYNLCSNGLSEDDQKKYQELYKNTIKNIKSQLST